MNILAIHAHPDDLEILAGGTLALLSQLGHSITMATMTAGDLGSSDRSTKETAALRKREATTSAGRIGARYVCLGFCDMQIFSDHSSRQRVVEAIRRAGPAVVLTASPIDYLCDHEATSGLVRDACFGAPLPHYHTGQIPAAPALNAIPHLYFMDPVGGVDRDDRVTVPDFWIDVSASFETKLAMLTEHASQRAWLRKHHGIDDYLVQMERWTAAQGGRAGTRYAEGFRRYKGHPYPQAPVLEDALKSYLSPRK
jgi:N-acetylglucosamine malate deacetylase 1